MFAKRAWEVGPECAAFEFLWPRSFFLYSATASAIQCDRPPTILDYAFCQDANLLSMVDEGAQIIQDIWPRLNRQQQEWLRQDQPAWRERTTTTCGLVAWPAMISPDITSCLRREVFDRNQILRSLAARPPVVPPPAAPQPRPFPPAPSTSEPTRHLEPATSEPSSASQPNPDYGGTMIVLAGLIIGLLVAFRALRAAARRRRIRRKVQRVKKPLPTESCRSLIVALFSPGAKQQQSNTAI